MTVRTDIRPAKCRQDLPFTEQGERSAPTARKRQATPKGKLSGTRTDRTAIRYRKEVIFKTHGTMEVAHLWAAITRATLLYESVAFSAKSELRSAMLATSRRRGSLPPRDTIPLG